ncbi:MAG: class I SAM-dependent RNA methyltransferase [Geobacteraceae bacterium]
MPQVVRIEKMSFGGAGFGRVDGKACFVPFTAPQDVCGIRTKRDKRSYMEGELIDLFETSPLRTVPTCPVFGECGGCSWQYLTYPAQLDAKQEIFAEMLWRSARVPVERVESIICAVETYGYRSRVQVKLHCSGGSFRIGFYRTGSHYVVDIPGECAIAHPAINHALTEIRPLLASCPDLSRVPQIDLAAGDDGAVIAIFHYIGSHYREFHEYLLENRACIASVSGIFLQRGRKSTIVKVAGVDFLSYRIPAELLPGSSPLALTFSRGGFSQVNYPQNQSLISTVCDWAKPGPEDKLLDLFCGNGNFSIPLAVCAAKVIGMENYPPSIADAARNAVANGVLNADFICCDVATGVKDMATKGKTFDVVIMDPPRTGAMDVVRHIPLLKPRAIIYVSCDPATLARDLNDLRNSGYEVVKSRPLDMFPQTYHIESVTLLEPLNGEQIQ